MFLNSIFLHYDPSDKVQTGHDEEVVSQIDGWSLLLELLSSVQVIPNWSLEIYLLFLARSNLGSLSNRYSLQGIISYQEFIFLTTPSSTGQMCRRSYWTFWRNTYREPERRTRWLLWLWWYSRRYKDPLDLRCCWSRWIWWKVVNGMRMTSRYHTSRHTRPWDTCGQRAPWCRY